MPDTLTTGRLRTVALLALPAFAALIAYFGVHDFGFVFDDDNALVTNEPLRAGDWWNAAFGAYNSLSNRPFSCFSLGLDFQLGLGPGGMHLVSLAIHAANAVLVALVIRALAGGCVLTAGLAATVWAVHPLGVDAVAYLTQRSMLWMAFFALLALLALLRSHTAPSPRRWQVVTVLATAFALCSKEEGAALPILLVLADRAFGASSWRELLPRWPFHLALASTWIVLIGCVALGPTNPTVGYATIPPATAWEWLLTQTQCLSHYARSVFLPNDLRGMYDFAVVREVGPAVVPGLVLLTALAGTVWAFRRRPALGFAGAVFFLLLAPTSSIYPIITEPCADRRMYLPLLAFVVPLAILAQRRLGNGTFAVVASVIAAAMAWQTHGTAATYRDQSTFVVHAAANNELTNRSFLCGRILAAYAQVMHDRGQIAESHALVERAMQCVEPGPQERLVEANMRQEQGRIAEAERLFRGLLRDYPDYADAMGNLAGLLHEHAMNLPEAAAMPVLAEAEQLLRSAIALAPRSARLHNTMAALLHSLGRVSEALPLLERALELQPDFDFARRNLGIAYLDVGQPRRALDAWAPLLAKHPNDPMLAQLVAQARARLRGR